MTTQRGKRSNCGGRRTFRATGPPLARTAIVLTLATIPRIAAGASPSARLTYVRSIDSASCPDEAALRSAVAARFGYDPFFPWAKKTVVVHIGHEAAHFVAHIELVDDSGLTRGTRDLRASDDDCAQIFDATALAISIALDAFGVSPEEAASPVAPAEGPPAPPNMPVSPLAPPLAPPAPESISPPARDRSRSPFFIGAEVLGSVGAAPGAAAGVGVFAAARAPSASLELRLHGDASAPVSVGPVGRAQTARFAATLAPCARLRVVFGCALAELGWLQAWGSDLDVARSAAMPFVAAGARLGVDLPVANALSVRVYAEGAFDLDRARFELDYYDVWTAPLVEGTLAIGVSRQIP